MAKKEIKLVKTTKKKASKQGISKDAARLNAILVENFVNLQKAMTNLAKKFDDLSTQISKLLQLFEISAKSFAEKLSAGTGTDIEKDKEFLEKLDRLLEQNKVIAKGLTLMEEKMRERLYGHSIPRPRFSQHLPQRMPNQPQGFSSGIEGYTESSMEKEKEEQNAR